MMKISSKIPFAILLFLFFSTGLTSAAFADSTPPLTTLTLNPADPDGANGWYRTPVGVSLAATDLESGVKSINWRINGGSWQKEEFGAPLNLVSNPSFEEGGDYPDAWAFSGTSGAEGARAIDAAKFETHSAKITAVSNGWSGFRNESNYLVVQPWSSLTASVWVKTNSVLGNGASFKVYALSPSGATQIAVSAVISGTADWTKLTQSFTVTVSDAYGVFFDFGLDGVGTVWFDGSSAVLLPTDTAVSFTLSQNGNDVMDYYSLDQSGNQENTQTENLKIDTNSPSNWREFELAQAGNDHTLTAEITVDDTVSGPSAADSHYQYSTDGGLHWGYRENLLSCSSEWHESGWKDDLSFPNYSPGDLTLTMKTPAVDYCNSNWSICKIVRFKTKDSAGNESQKDICIYGAWIKVEGGGDAYAGNGINFSSAGSDTNSDGLAVTGNNILANFSTTNNWNLLAYPLINSLDYSYWLNLSAGTPATVTQLPTENGSFRVNSSFTVAATTIPPNLATSEFAAVMFINGDLTINRNYSLPEQSGLIFIVAGKVKVDRAVTQIAGYFITNDSFDTAYNGGGNGETLIINGGIAANRLLLNRSLKTGRNNLSPAESFIFKPVYYLKFSNIFSKTSSFSWRETQSESD